jgi:hypothetical protein
VTRQPAPPPTGPAAGRVQDWRVFRPAIWLGMLGVAVMLLLNFYVGLAVLGGAIGVGARIQASRRRVAAGGPVRRSRRR